MLSPEPVLQSLSNRLPGVIQIQEMESGDILGYLGRKCWAHTAAIYYVKSRSEAVTVQMTPGNEIFLLNMESDHMGPLCLALVNERPADSSGFLLSQVITAPRNKNIPSSYGQAVAGSRKIWIRNADDTITPLPGPGLCPAEMWTFKADEFGDEFNETLHVVRHPTGENMKRQNGSDIRLKLWRIVKLVFESL